MVYFSPYLCCTPQGMREKRGKFRVIFDASTQSYQHELVLNQVTDSEFEAIIDFGQSKMRLYISIYNWRISFPGEIIYLVLADISACFRYPRIAADLTGAFGFLFEKTILSINESRFWIQHFRKFMGTISACDQEQYSHLFSSGGSCNQAQGPPRHSKMG